MSTFVLKWNPAISSFSYDDYLQIIARPYEMDLNWSFHDWDKVRDGDRVFFLRVGEKPQLLASGFTDSKAYEGGDWAKRGRRVYYADLSFDFACHLEYANVISAELLEKEVPGFEWRGGHSGVMLNDDQAEKLELLWTDFLYNHQADFYDEGEEDDYVGGGEKVILDDGDSDEDDDYEAEPFLGITGSCANSFSETYGDSDDSEKYKALQNYLHRERGSSCHVCGYSYQKVFGSNCRKNIPYVYIKKSSSEDWRQNFFCICPSCEKLENEDWKLFERKFSS